MREDTLIVVQIVSSTFQIPRSRPDPDRLVQIETCSKLFKLKIADPGLSLQQIMPRIIIFAVICHMGCWNGLGRCSDDRADPGKARVLIEWDFRRSSSGTFQQILFVDSINIEY